VAAEWRELGCLHPCIGYSDERIDFFLARKLEFKGAQPDEGEFLETMRVPLSEAVDWIRRGRTAGAPFQARLPTCNSGSAATAGKGMGRANRKPWPYCTPISTRMSITA